MSQRICCRSRSPPRRYRTISDAAPAIRHSATVATQTITTGIVQAPWGPPVTRPSIWVAPHCAATMPTVAAPNAHGTARQPRPAGGPEGKTSRSASRPARLTGQNPLAHGTVASGPTWPVTSATQAVVQARAGPTGELGSCRTITQPTATAMPHSRHEPATTQSPTDTAKIVADATTRVAAPTSARDPARDMRSSCQRDAPP